MVNKLKDDDKKFNVMLEELRRHRERQEEYDKKYNENMVYYK